MRPLQRSFLATPPAGTAQTSARSRTGVALRTAVPRLMCPLMCLFMCMGLPVGADFNDNFVRNTAVVTDADNSDLLTKISAGIAAHNIVLPAAFSPDPIIGAAAEVTVYGANIVLKYIPPTLQQPPDLIKEPNSADSCTWDFTMPQTSWKRVDYLGFVPLSPLPNDWGELGTPEVYHANTDVVVRAINSRIPLAESPPRVGIFARNEPANAMVRFPSGDNVVRWEAEAQIDPIMDLILPPVLTLAATDFKYGSIGLNVTGNAAKNLAKSQRIKSFALDLLIEAGTIVGGEALDEFNLPDALQGQQTAAHHREQTVTVYDVLDPKLELPQTVFTFEATDFGGTSRSRFWEQEVAPTFIASDPCDNPISIVDDGPEVLFPLGTTAVNITVSDPGPNRLGGRNSVTRSLQVVVEDTQAPIVVAPPSRVVEVPAGTTGLNPAELVLGKPRVVDLADAAPTIDNDGPAFYPVDSRANIIWSATDSSGNTGTDRQFVTVKTEGTNTAPVVTGVTSSTLTSQPVDIVLRGTDSDFLDGQFDPLSFNIETPPARGEFIAPLLPFFINDFRTNPAGPYGEDFRLGTGFGGNRFNWMGANVCQANVNPIAGLSPRTFDRGFVYEPVFVKVLDDGTYFLLDEYWECNGDRAQTEPRISKWSKDDEFLGQIDYSGNFDHFVLDDDGFIYVLRRETGSRAELVITQCGTAFEEFNGGHCGRRWKFDFSSAANIAPERLAYARVDAAEGLLYVADAVRLYAFDVRDTQATLPGEPFRTTRPAHVGTLFNGERLYGAVRAGANNSCGSGATSGFTIDLDSQGNLYTADECDRRVHKFNASRFSSTGEFEPGEYVGWMGYCESSTNKACDDVKQASKGYSCTNETCSVPSALATGGSELGQFSSISHLAVGPEDILYVVDSGNRRIQRFGPDGTFAGQAVSQGTGVNQGDQPGFVLGNFGRSRTVSVNRSNFFVVDSDEELVHIFQTSPFKDITNDSATVSYVSQFDAHSITDTFTYTATDGLAVSAPATAMVSVSRNFRAPEAFPQPNLVVLEDSNLEVTLDADDPDGIAGVDFNGLDTLTYRVVRQPRDGSLSGTGAELTYTPDPDFSGSDYFLFVASDGLEDSVPARIDITVVPVDDAPRVTELGLPDTWGRGFPVLMSGTFFDDGSENYDTRVEWGDGTVTPRGDFVEDENGLRLTGVKLIEPFSGTGRGQAVAEHTFTANANRTVSLCVSDQDNKETCAQESLNILPLVMLSPSLFVPIETVPHGETSTIAITLTNTQPTGYAGLPATNVRLTQDANTNLEVVNLTSAPNGCAITNGLLDCLLAVMASGASIAFTAEVRFTGPTFFDTQANFSVTASNLTPAVVPEALTTTILSFTADSTDSDGDGLSDAWEIAFGLDPANNDAELDSDNDGLNNSEEFANQTNPQKADTDDDGFSDGEEVANQTSPTVAADTDRDGEPNDIDLDDDNDGMSDQFERTFGLDALQASDALEDLDGDGVSNLAEAQAGTNPNDSSDRPAESTAQPTLFSSVLPLNRATVVDSTVSAFATILNTGDAATGCALAPLAPIDADFAFQLTNPATNEPIAAKNTAGPIAAGAAQSFVFEFTPRSEQDSNISFRFACDGGEAANTVDGVNTFVLQASITPTADLVALAATTSNDGVVTLNGGIGAFSVASVNVGAEGFLTARARTPQGSGISVTLCQTNPDTAACINPGLPAAEATAFFDENATPTFSVFPAASGPVAFDPAQNRVFVEFFDDTGVVRGATSVAVRSD